LRLFCFNIIAAALNLYYDGLSLRKTQRSLKQIFGEKVSQVTILNWIRKYSKLVKEYECLKNITDYYVIANFAENINNFQQIITSGTWIEGFII